MKRIIIIVTLLLLIRVVNAQTQQEWRDSVSVLSTMIEQNPRNVTLRLRKAAANIELGQWQYALDEYTNVLELDAGNLNALYYRGYVNQHMGRLSFARKDYEDVLSHEPLNLHAFIGLIYVNLDDNRQGQALYDANRLVEAYPNKAEALAVRADVEKTMNMIDAAIEDIENAIKIEDVIVRKKYPSTIDDNITSYQLTAFSLYMKKTQKEKARAALDYLVENGVSRGALIDYYKIITAK